MRTRTRARLAPIVMTGVLLGGGLAAGTATVASADVSKAAESDATAQSCYGGAQNYTAVAGRDSTSAYWPKDSFRRVSGRCGDINVKVNSDRKVVVCWKGHSCPTDWVQGKRGRWVVVDHINGRKDFYLKFRGTNNGTGQVAY